MTYSELEKILKKNGCRVLREGRSHSIWISDTTGETFTVPRHKTQEVPKGTLQSIKKAAGLA